LACAGLATSLSTHILSMTETWRGCSLDVLELSEMLPSGYDILQLALLDKCGVGVIVLLTDGLCVKGDPLLDRRHVYSF